MLYFARIAFALLTASKPRPRLSARSRVSITAPSSAMVEFSDALVTVVSPKILGNDVNRSAPPSGYARSSKPFTMEEAGARLTSGMPPLLKQFELSQADGLCFGDKRAFAPGRQTLRDQDWGGAGGVGGGVEAQQGLQNGQAPHGHLPESLGDDDIVERLPSSANRVPTGPDGRGLPNFLAPEGGVIFAGGACDLIMCGSTKNVTAGIGVIRSLTSSEPFDAFIGPRATNDLCHVGTLSLKVSLSRSLSLPQPSPGPCDFTAPRAPRMCAVTVAIDTTDGPHHVLCVAARRR